MCIRDRFTERVPMVKGRLDKKASTATGYSWLVWEKDKPSAPRLMWVPPCRKSLERANDYDMPLRPVAKEPNPRAEKKKVTQDDLFGT